ncbi:cysteine-rich motor neuron 1 protein isoform X2 [Culex pipiens pallens]|uniref:cysteine-rich motor neuron 1 protein isoform X2 n=1 Tax=Culex pipiens pallens TaxID=42434 RepID=UPI00195482D5|nr:cysteine-rich motor neuron 1 protein isoform X2 [Culex pipiens pallens]
MESSKCVRGFVVTASSSIPSAIRLFLCFLFLLNSESLGLKCVCNPNECETIRSEDCPGRGMIVWDPCRCCRVCARTFGEACGGPGDFSGTCEPPLSCVSKIPVGGSGICLEKNACRGVACPSPEPCPVDSYPKAVNSHFTGFYPDVLKGAGNAVRNERAIEYNGLHRGSTNVSSNTEDRTRHRRSVIEDELLIQYCCPRYECACKPNYCDQKCSPKQTPLNLTSPTDYKDIQYGVPGNCCFPCKENYCLHPTFRRHGATWHSDDCTTCVCLYGEVKCQQSSCKAPNCVAYKLIPGECCPVCDSDASNFCKHVGNCDIHCKYGYARQGDCDLCECIRISKHHPIVETDISKTERNFSISNHNISKDNTIEKPHQQHTHKSNSNPFSTIQFWILVLTNLVAVLVLILLIVWCCHFRKSAKYSTVQVA